MQGIQNSKCTSQVSKPSTFGIQEITRYDLRTFFPKLACSLVSPKRSGLRYAKAISTHHWAAADGLPIRPGKRCRASRFYVLWNRVCKWRYGTCFCKSYVFIVRTIVTIPNTSILKVLLVLQYMFCWIWYFDCMPTHCILPRCWTTPLVTFTAVFCPRTSQCDLSPRTTRVCLSETHPSL